MVFLNDNRPATRFLYFHFLMALIRIKDLKRLKWESIWARYYEERLFPTPGNYNRHSMQMALAKYSGTIDMDAIGSWISENGFDSPLPLTSDEASEAVRRTLETVYMAASESDRSLAGVVEDENEDGDIDKDGDEIEDDDQEHEDESGGY